MATITEDYVSFEVAKLLNEKGFQVDTDKDYWKIGEDGTKYFMCSIGVYTSDPNNKYAFYRPANSYPCPTQSVAMKWLREVHCIHIVTAFLGHSLKWTPTIWKIDMVIPESKHVKSTLNTWETYEEATEAAIKYCLEHLI